MAKTGRPKADNPKRNIIGIRMSDEERARLSLYAADHKMTMTEAVLRAVHLMYESDGEGAKTLPAGKELLWQMHEKTAKDEH